MCIMILLDLKIWPLDSDLVHVSAMPPSVALIKAVERFACFVSLYFFGCVSLWAGVWPGRKRKSS